MDGITGFIILTLSHLKTCPAWLAEFEHAVALGKPHQRPPSSYHRNRLPAMLTGN